MAAGGHHRVPFSPRRGVSRLVVWWHLQLRIQRRRGKHSSECEVADYSTRNYHACQSEGFLVGVRFRRHRHRSGVCCGFLVFGVVVVVVDSWACVRPGGCRCVRVEGIPAVGSTRAACRSAPGPTVYKECVALFSLSLSLSQLIPRSLHAFLLLRAQHSAGPPHGAGGRVGGACAVSSDEQEHGIVQKKMIERGCWCCVDVRVSWTENKKKQMEPAREQKAAMQTEWTCCALRLPRPGNSTRREKCVFVFLCVWCWLIERVVFAQAAFVLTSG